MRRRCDLGVGFSSAVGFWGTRALAVATLSAWFCGLPMLASAEDVVFGAPASKGLKTHVFSSEPSTGGVPSQSALTQQTMGPITVGSSVTPYPASATVSGSTGAITNVRATVTMTHPNVSEVRLLLVSPAGTKVELMQGHDAGSYNTLAASSDTFIFDGRAAAGTIHGAYGGYTRPRVTGAANTYPAPAPAGPYVRTLSSFNGESANGGWSVYAVDSVPGSNSGSISLITLDIETATCNYTIPEFGPASTYPINITVGGFDSGLHNVRVIIRNLNHTYPRDIRVLVQAPWGATCLLMQGALFNQDLVNETITFQQGAETMPQTVGLDLSRPRVFQPSVYGAVSKLPDPAPNVPYGSALLPNFENFDAGGTWKVYIDDNSGADSGCFESVSLEIVEDDFAGISNALFPLTDFSIQLGGSTTGWSDIGLSPASNFVVLGGPSSGYFPLTISAHPTKIRTCGLVRNKSGWLGLTPGNAERLQYVGRFSMSRSGQSNPNDFNQIPNMRLRMQQRFAVNSMLEVFNHTGDTAAQTALEQELRPALGNTSNTLSSVYQVGLLPVVTPRSTSTGEGVQCAVEAYATLPQDQGTLRFGYAILGSQRRIAAPVDTVPLKQFVPTSSNAGSLAVFNSAAELANFTLNYGAAADDPPVLGPGAGGTYADGFSGITLSTVGQATAPPLRVVSRNINPEEGGSAFVSRVRAEEEMLYTARFHVNSTQIAPFQSQLRLRMRTIKFAWSQKLELGGTYAAGSINNAVARQVVPGFGSLNLAKNVPSDPGVWYDLKMYSPMNNQIRPEFPFNTPLSTVMPNISSQAGPGVASASRRDIFVGLDILDTLSSATGYENEGSQVVVDEIQLHKYSENF